MSATQPIICSTVGWYRNKGRHYKVCSQTCVNIFNTRKCCECLYEGWDELEELDGKYYCTRHPCEKSCYDKMIKTLSKKSPMIKSTQKQY